MPLMALYCYLDIMFEQLVLLIDSVVVYYVLSPTLGLL